MCKKGGGSAGVWALCRRIDVETPHASCSSLARCLCASYRETTTVDGDVTVSLSALSSEAKEISLRCRLVESFADLLADESSADLLADDTVTVTSRPPLDILMRDPPS